MHWRELSGGRRQKAVGSRDSLSAFRLLLSAFFLAACVSPQSTPVLPTLPVTRVASLETATPLPPTRTANAPPVAAIVALSATPSLTQTRVDPSPTPSATVPPVVHLMAVGDLMLAGGVGERITTEGPAIPFAGVASTLSSADLLVANLECTLSESGEPQHKAYTFRAPPAVADALALAGVDVVSLANNHSLDYGFEALAGTEQLLSQRAIAFAGAGSNEAAARAPAIVERNGLRVAFLAYVDVLVETRTHFDTRSWIATADTPGVAWAEVDHIAADVAAARAQADVVVVLLHFGLEGRTPITPAQRAVAHAAIDAGAALVLGAHPHVLQGVERYNGGLIAYSLGNFVFEGFTFPENYSAIFTATLTRDGVGEYNWIPVVVEGGLPRLATPDESSNILALVQPLK